MVAKVTTVTPTGRTTLYGRAFLVAAIVAAALLLPVVGCSEPASSAGTGSGGPDAGGGGDGGLAGDAGTGGGAEDDGCFAAPIVGVGVIKLLSDGEVFGGAEVFDDEVVAFPDGFILEPIWGGGVECAVGLDGAVDVEFFA